ncbi:4-hydroxy-tetrahydrodipicolinate synthase [candidate division WOR-3 bacterium]|nr:4-hydroxy-tetrahydrodipicolinate synthase [candidate division WOR-3 bacterium]MCK4528182.1 4-hydroxy-tetrahydrodipicolinate synthase [candidate division WOR-3 bacterium]
MKKGAYTLMVTPFKDDSSLDEQGLRNNTRRQIESGIHGLAPLGVTGENTLLSIEEIKTVLRIVVEEVGGKMPVIPDTCAMGLREAIEKAKLFADNGATHCAAYVPFFVLPKQDGIKKFYETLADESDIPIILHNAAGRTCVNMIPKTTEQLAKHPNIVGIKDGNKQLDHLAAIIHLTKDEDFEVFTGKDTTAYPLLCAGGSGTFTVAGNIVPKVMKNIVNWTLEGKKDEAEKLHREYFSLFEAVRFETNPMGAKAALELMGYTSSSVRLPLTPLSEKKWEELKAIMNERGLL